MARKILLSFLGTGDYAYTTYRFDRTNLEYDDIETRFVAHALSKAIEPDEIFMVTTKEAEECHGEDLMEICAYQPLIINPDDNDWYWDLLRRLKTWVQPGDQLFIDVTHSFRSVPMIGLAIALYLRTIFRLQDKPSALEIKGIYYASYRPGVRQDETNIEHLTPLLDLFDWMQAVEAFSTYGDPAPMGNLVNHDGSPLRQDGNARKLKREMEKFDLSMRFLMPRDAGNAATQSVSALTQLKRRLPVPISVLFDTLVERLEPMKIRIKATREEQLGGQIAQITFLIETRQWGHAWLMAREALVTHFLITLDKEPYSFKERELSASAMWHVSAPLKKHWIETNKYRNPVAHAKMTSRPRENLIGLREASKKKLNRIVNFLHQGIGNYDEYLRAYDRKKSKKNKKG